MMTVREFKTRPSLIQYTSPASVALFAASAAKTSAAKAVIGEKSQSANVRIPVGARGKPGAMENFRVRHVLDAKNLFPAVDDLMRFGEILD